MCLDNLYARYIHRKTIYIIYIYRYVIKFIDILLSQWIKIQNSTLFTNNKVYCKLTRLLSTGGISPGFQNMLTYVNICKFGICFLKLFDYPTFWFQNWVFKEMTNVLRASPRSFAKLNNTNHYAKYVYIYFLVWLVVLS